MKSKKIANIVFYKFYENGVEKRQTCIFYNDGTSEIVSYDQGIDACEIIVKERHITSKDVFREMINNDIIYVTTGREFEKNYNNYIVNEATNMESQVGLSNEEGPKIFQKGKMTIPTVASSNVVNPTEGKEIPVVEASEGPKVEEEQNEEEFAEEVKDETKTAAETTNSIPISVVEEPSQETAEESEKKDNPTKSEQEIENSEAEFEDEDKLEDEAEFEDDENELEDEAEFEDDENELEDEAEFEDDENELEDEFEDDENELEDEAEFEDDEDELEDEAEFEDDEDELEDEAEFEDDEDKLEDEAEFEDEVDKKEHALDVDDEIEDEVDKKEDKSKKEAGFFKRIWNKIKKNKLVKWVVLCVTTLAVGLGMYSCAKHQTKEGVMVNSNITSEASVSDDVNGLSGELIFGDNDYYENYDFNQLVEVTENKTQKSAMTRLHDTITEFNGPFADAYIEEGKSVRAALSFDEVVALQQAYNDYSDEQIKAYFNGSKMDADTLTKDYKSGTLQLMGAYVIETRDNQVDTSKLLRKKEHKEYNKQIHELLLSAKEATGDDKLNKIKAFYDRINKDFPITDEVRTDGIMHRLDYDKVESYKMSVVPMIAAAEIMFQNYDVDYTLSSRGIDFLNDIGYCNFAQDKFENIEDITKDAKEDNTNPLYEQYRNSVIGELENNSHYVIDDETRDLSQLDRFQSIVNWHFNIKDGSFTGGGYYTTGETSTWTETNTTYREETTVTEKEITEEAKAEVDREIAEENEKSKQEGEKEAEDTRNEMQEDADKEAEKVEDEIKEEEDDFKDALEDANDKLENGDNVYEDDFGGANVEFDDDFKDEDGKLDNSVGDITTDGEGDKTDEALPDPNETGKDLDDNEPEYNREDVKEETDPTITESSGQTIIEYEEEISNEELVDNYINSLEASSEEDAQTYQYTK